jgi:hypothetical protein
MLMGLIFSWQLLEGSVQWSVLQANGDILLPILARPVHQVVLFVLEALVMTAHHVKHSQMAQYTTLTSVQQHAQQPVQMVNTYHLQFLIIVSSVVLLA